MKTIFSLLLAVSFNIPSLFEQGGDESTYVNDVYHFSAIVPKNWVLHRQILNDSIQHRAIVDWGLPSTHSDQENADIENSVSITVYRRSDIRNKEELIQSEYLRLNSMQYAMEAVAERPDERVIFGSVNGLKYKGKSYFIFSGGFGYIINFMATPGTYDKNILLFERFRNNISLR